MAVNLSKKSRRSIQGKQETFYEHLVNKVQRLIGHRLAPRAEISDKLEVTVKVDKRAEESFIAKVDNISAGGLAFYDFPLTTTLERGDSVNMEVQSSQLIDSPVLLLGRVRHRTLKSKVIDGRNFLRDTFGVQFEMLSHLQLEELDELISKIYSHYSD